MKSERKRMNLEFLNHWPPQHGCIYGPGENQLEWGPWQVSKGRWVAQPYIGQQDGFPGTGLWTTQPH